MELPNVADLFTLAISVASVVVVVASVAAAGTPQRLKSLLTI